MSRPPADTKTPKDFNASQGCHLQSGATKEMEALEGGPCFITVYPRRTNNNHTVCFPKPHRHSKGSLLTAIRIPQILKTNPLNRQWVSIMDDTVLAWFRVTMGAD